MDISIIIPSWKHLDDCLHPCLESIRKHTNLDEVEVLVVANGCGDDGTREYVESLGWPFRLIWIEEQVGYTKAANLGLKTANGEFLVLLNNDCQILGPGWLDILKAPFLSDPKTGVSGPMKEWCPWAERHFILFFCAMMRRSVVEARGFMDESYSPGYGEDSDLCARIEDAGYKIVQVPDNSYDFYGASKRTGQFPLYHEGNVSFKNWPGGEDLLRRNQARLAEKFGGHITSAKKLDGFMSEAELAWLARAARNALRVIEIGSWHGRSSRAIADNLPPDGKLYCIDTWAGSLNEQDTNHASARQDAGDHAFIEFCQGMKDHIISGKVVPMRINSRNAPKVINEKADVIFIDADHTYEGCKADIETFRPLLKDGGILCGHDYRHANGVWEGVTRAVDERFETEQPAGTNIWVRKADKIQQPRLFDCLTFFNELDLLELRLSELDSVVDRVVIAEATQTHQGDPKPLYFKENIQRFEKWLPKISHIVVDFPEFKEDAVWSRERFQRNALMRALEKEARPEDYCIISDADEIPSANSLAFRSSVSDGGIHAFDMRLFSLFLNLESEHSWREARLTTFKTVKELTPCGVRYFSTPGIISNGGWHFTAQGGVDAVKQKIQSFAHWEFNRPDILANVAQSAKHGTDLFGRPDEKFQVVQMDDSWPSYIRVNQTKFESMGWVKQ